jgi:hypothetical protein
VRVECTVVSVSKHNKTPTKRVGLVESRHIHVVNFNLKLITHDQRRMKQMVKWTTEIQDIF